MNVPFNAESRKSILDKYTTARERREELEFLALQGETGPSYDDEVSDLIASVRDLSTRYENGLPKVPVSRCPFTGDRVVHSLDTFGIDGLWWDYESPQRPIEALPDTFHTFSGALQIRDPVEMTAFVVRPGPGVPFVIPGLLGNPSVVAVLSSVRIGAHTGYPVCYFSSNPESVEFLPDSWGASERLESRGIAGRGWSSRELKQEEMDFDLEPWIRSEKLGWISPDDQSSGIRTTSDDCPYIGLEGVKQFQTVFRGKVTYG